MGSGEQKVELSLRYPKKILFGLQEGDCNLSCPKCYTHGKSSPTTTPRNADIFDLKKFGEICSEISKFPVPPRVTPQTWDEPLLTPMLVKYLKVMKDFGLTVTMDTNGILLVPEMRRELLKLKIDSIFVSLDAINPETYERVRGKNTLRLVEKNLLKFIEERGTSLLPRIGVSFVSEEANVDEEELFVDKWKEIVDVIRVNKVFTSERKIKMTDRAEREACWSLYDSMMVHPNGDVSLCCVDTHSEVKVGNAFESSILDIWNKGEFPRIRNLHEEGKFDQISICKNCDLWTNDSPQILETEGHIISKTESHYYVNRKNKLATIPTTNRYVSQELIQKEWE